MNTTELSLKPQPTSFLRWTALLLISLAMMGNYYIYDSISPLADLLKAQLGFSDSNIGLLNAIYSFPNIIMVLVGGLVIDRIGTKTSVLIFTASLPSPDSNSSDRQYMDDVCRKINFWAWCRIDDSCNHNNYCTLV